MNFFRYFFVSLLLSVVFATSVAAMGVPSLLDREAIDVSDGQHVGMVEKLSQLFKKMLVMMGDASTVELRTLQPQTTALSNLGTSGAPQVATSPAQTTAASNIETTATPNVETTEAMMESFRLISFDGGKAGASSCLLCPKKHFAPENAFELGIWEGEHKGWHNEEGTPLPQTVWYRFPKAVTVGKFSFSSIDACCPDFSPRKFDLVGSADCATWITIQSYETEFTKESETKEWTVPAGSRKSFRCFGIRVTESGFSLWTAIKHMKMWSSDGE